MSSVTLEDIQNRFREFLKEEFEKRKIKHEKYSLRDYAKSAGIRVSALSEILNGKRNVSAKLAQRVFENVGAPRKTIGFFLKEFNFIRSRPAFLAISEDKYELICETRFYAFMALMETKGFISDIKWIAQRLQLTEELAKDTIETLVQLELVERDVWGELTLSQANLQSPDGGASEANRKSHLQGIEMAKKSLEVDDVKDRDFSAMIFPLCPSLLPKVEAKIRSLYEELSALSETAPKREVYRINVQMFPITKVRR